MLRSEVHMKQDPVTKQFVPEYHGIDPAGYKTVGREMDLWRIGAVSFPQSYIEWHKAMAKACLAEWEKKGVKRYGIRMEHSGWFDGMMQVDTVIELASGKLIKVRWHDSHSHGYFMQCSQDSGGSFSFDIDEAIKKDAEELEARRERNRRCV